MRNRVALPEARHAVRLRERARDDDARILERHRHVRLVIRIGDVVEVGLVDQDRRLRRACVAIFCEEVARRLRADVGGGRVVRVAVEHQPGALRRGHHLVDVDLELGVQLDAASPGCPISSA